MIVCTPMHHDGILLNSLLTEVAFPKSSAVLPKYGKSCDDASMSRRRSVHHPAQLVLDDVLPFKCELHAALGSVLRNVV